MQNYAKLMQTYLKLILPLHYTHENKLSILFLKISQNSAKLSTLFKVGRGGVTTPSHFKAYSRLFTLMQNLCKTYVIFCNIMQTSAS